MVEAGGKDEELVPSTSTEFAAEVFDLNSIKKAAYRICDIAAVDIEPREGKILCTLRFHQPQKRAEAERTVNDFKIEVLDQNLRSVVTSETEAVRNAILAYAFSKTGMQGVE